jgi:hypothetical protein
MRSLVIGQGEGRSAMAPGRRLPQSFDTRPALHHFPRPARPAWVEALSLAARRPTNGALRV